MIFVDDINTIPKGDVPQKAKRYGSEWCHMWTEPGNETELHKLALKIGLKKAYFQNVKDFPHYDLIPSKRAQAVKLGAEETSLRAWIRKQKVKKRR